MNKTIKNDFLALLATVIMYTLWGTAWYYATPNEATEAPRTKIEVSKATKEANQHATRQELTKKQVVGVASWYDYTLKGIEWSKTHRTAASRTFKRYSMVKVTNTANGKSVEVYINDFGPEEGQTPERIIDLSSHAFGQIADLKQGLINIKAEQL